MVLAVRKGISWSITVLKYGMLTWYYAGPRITLRELAHRLYDKVVFYGTIKDFRDPSPPSSFPCYVRMASANDMKELHRSNRSGLTHIIIQWLSKSNRA